jgi:iron complex transport system permease protein
MKLSFLVIFLFLAVALLLCGPLGISELSADVLYYIRIPRLITTILIGVGISVSGLLLQTLLQNPLAGPFVIGVNSGASLLVAIYIIISPVATSNLGTVIVACIGSVSYLLILLAINVTSRVTLLLVGLILSYFTSGIIGIVVAVGNASDLQKYMLWSLGSVNRVEGYSVLWFAMVITVGFVTAICLSKQLGLLSLGRNYAESMGVNYPKLRTVVIGLISILAGVVTAYCGPIVFLGLLAPHLSRRILKSGNFLHLILLTSAVGVIISLMAVVIMQLLAPLILIPVNSILSLLALPIIFILIGYADAAN